MKKLTCKNKITRYLLCPRNEDMNNNIDCYGYNYLIILNDYSL